MRLPAQPPSSASRMEAGSTLPLRPKTSASATALSVPATMIWLHALVTWPAPLAPPPLGMGVDPGDQVLAVAGSRLQPDPLQAAHGQLNAAIRQLDRVLDADQGAHAADLLPARLLHLLLELGRDRQRAVAG